MKYNTKIIDSPYPIKYLKRLFDGRFFVCVILVSLNICLINLWLREDARILKITHEIEKVTVILQDQEAFRDLFKFSTQDMSEKIFDTTPLSEFSQIFDSLAASSSLHTLSYIHEQKPVLPDVFEDGSTQKHAIRFKCHAKSDTAIYKFLFNLQKQSPGFIIIETVYIAQNPHDTLMDASFFVGDIMAIIINNAPREKNVAL